MDGSHKESVFIYLCFFKKKKEPKSFLFISEVEVKV